MSSVRAGLVDIVRDFLTAHRLMARLFARYARGELRFAELEELVGDDESSVLFRLKERCHALFRPGAGGSRLAMERGVLFDLAVGSLFHEAMNLRENFYQREVYGPRMRELRAQAREGTDALFQEFERTLAMVSRRLEEDVEEVEALFLRTREELRVVLIEHRNEGHVVRCLLEQRALVEEVFGESLDSLLAGIFGDSAAGYALAGRSYLASGYFDEADRALGEAIARGGDRAELASLCSYARGMFAYQRGNYAASVEHLAEWIDSRGTLDPGMIDFAHSAVSRVEQIVPEDDRGRVVPAAAALLAQIGARRSPARAASGP